jgi:hydrogenase maturation protease
MSTASTVATAPRATPAASVRLAQPPASPRTAVVALGSVVMCDDGAGAAALGVLEAGWELPEAVDRLDLGTPGPYFAEYVRGYDALIVMDALRTPGAPGEVKRFDEEELRRTPSGPRLTPHVLDLGEALAALDFEGCRPRRVVAVGVVPERVRAGTELSPVVSGALPVMAALVARELEALGFAAPRRERPEISAPWWEGRATS